MATTPTKHNLFTLNELRQAMPKVGPMVQRPLEKMLALDGINGIYDRAAAECEQPADFSQKCLDDLDVGLDIKPEDLARIPRTGPLVIVANHPFGGVEGLILSSVMLKVRPDFKAMVNQFLGVIPEMRATSIYVDSLGSNKAASMRGLKQSIQLLRDGGCMGVFPSGTVSHLHLSTRKVEDPQWSPHIGALIRRTGASVVPVFFAGKNGFMFQLAGLIHPRLRTALLPRQVLNKKHTTFALQIGRVISAREIARLENDQAVSDYLRNRTYALNERAITPLKPWRKLVNLLSWRPRDPAVEVASPVDASRLERELSHLPPENLLASNTDLKCYLANWEEAPSMMRELGRLREATFRSVGEGTGKEIDVDDFDQTYKHLLVWNSAKRELVGGYRIGLTDEVTAHAGYRGLYTHSLFNYRSEFLFQLGPTLELGRSFVRSEYQRSFSPLLLLWKGIGGFVSRNPKYRYLLGPVSISNTYSPLSRALISEFMNRPDHCAAASTLVRPRTPFKVKDSIVQRAQLLAMPIADLDDLNDLISDIEPDGKGVPVLLKQYLKLGAKALAFNVDPAFGHCLDCLCLLDLTSADRRSLDRYMGKEPMARYLAAHQNA